MNKADREVFSLLAAGKIDKAYIDALSELRQRHLRLCAQNILTPEEFENLGNALPTHQSLLTRLSRNLIGLSNSGQTKQAPYFRRTSFSPYVHLYQSSKRKRHKTLLVLLSGNGLNFGVDVPNMLRALGGLDLDILQITDPIGESLRFGAPEIAKNLPGLAEWIEETLTANSYQRRAVFGLSVNALTAYIMGHYMPFDVCVGFSPSSFSDTHQMLRGDKRPNAYNPIHCQPNIGGAVQLSVIGENSQRDIDALKELHFHNPISHYQIRDTADHSVIYGLFAQGRLADTVNALLGATHDGIPNPPSFMKRAEINQRP